MTDIPRQRLRNQQISRQDFRTAGDVVSWLGAVQSQDYSGGKWAIGLRLPHGTDSKIERAIADRQVVRTWPMRGTLHFVPAAGVRWMLKLLTPRVIRAAAARHRQLELDAKVFAKAGRIFEKALTGHRQVTRRALYNLLNAEGIETNDARGLHLLSYHAMHGLICFAANEGKQATFALLDEWLPEARLLQGDEAIAELTKRYFTGHGPATVQDFGWWSGLTQREVKTGLDLAGDRLLSETVEGTTYWMSPETPPRARRSAKAYLLPPYDEFTVGYRDRSAVLAPQFASQASGGGIFFPVIVIDGQVVGTWKRQFARREVSVTLAPFRRFSAEEREATRRSAERFAGYLGMPLVGVT